MGRIVQQIFQHLLFLQPPEEFMRLQLRRLLDGVVIGDLHEGVVEGVAGILLGLEDRRKQVLIQQVQVQVLTMLHVLLVVVGALGDGLDLPDDLRDALAVGLL